MEEIMKYLNAHKAELFEGKKVTYRGKVYWVDAHGWGNFRRYYRLQGCRHLREERSL